MSGARGAVAIRCGRVRVGGAWAYYAEAGAGPPVVVAAGLGLSTRFYEPLMLACARAGLRLLVPDLPGFGRTPGPLTGCSVAGTAGWLLRFADAVGLDGPGWLGHSVGCQVVSAIAAEQPGRAAALALSGPTGAPGRHRPLRQLGLLARAAAGEPGSLLLAVARSYLRMSPTAYVGSWLRAGRDQPAARLARVRCPVLVLVGERDPMPESAFVALLRDRLPSVTVAHLRGGGHGLPREAAEAFTRVAAPFFRAHVAGPARGADPRQPEGDVA